MVTVGFPNVGLLASKPNLELNVDIPVCIAISLSLSSHYYSIVFRRSVQTAH